MTRPVTDADVRADLDAMRKAVAALSSIPSAGRRRAALDWLITRVEADIDRLKETPNGPQNPSPDGGRVQLPLEDGFA